jgi:hypothetical protein
LVCAPADAPVFLKAYTSCLKASVNRITALENAKRITPHPVWQADYEAPVGKLPSTALPLYVNVNIQSNGTHTVPPRGVKLSDENLYLVTKAVSYDERGKDYPEDFNRAGDIKPERTPEDPAPLFCGLYFFAVYKGYYILGGRQYAIRFETKLANKVDKALTGSVGWTISKVQTPTGAHKANTALRRTYHNP